MKEFTEVTDSGFIWYRGHERLRIVAWGRNGIRVQVTHEAAFKSFPGGLLPKPATPAGTRVEVTDDSVTLVHGEITVALSGRLGEMTFSRTSNGEVLLRECKKTTAEYRGRTFIPNGGTWKIEQRFLARDDEKFYGLGQRQHGYLNQKGCVLDLFHRNTEVSIPFMVSSLGYGFLWNHPGVGRVELGRNETRWVAESAHELDYYMVADESPAALLERYAEVTGKPSEFPDWAAGFWQSKLRYKTQDELLDVAREYHRRGLPVSVMVVDFHHWPLAGEWSFERSAWPAPAEMVSELRSMGMELMVSVWPTVHVASRNYSHMADHGYLVRNERGMPLQNGESLESFYDATNPGARAFLWEQIREGYIKHGIRAFWLDTMEPETIPLEPDNTRYHSGNGLEVSGLYPLRHQQGFYEGLLAEGEAAPLTLGRSAWVGSQKYGGAVWSADIPSTFDSLRRQVTGGLNIAMSGIPWWCSDIGGFYGGEIDDPGFQELLIRWYQYGVFCPIMRTHGVRRQGEKKGENIGKADPNHPNVPNEVWSFGDEVCGILSEQIQLRHRLRPYLLEQMGIAQESGLPPMRPLFVDFPGDARAWHVEDEFMFGPDLLVAPIVTAGARAREVYLPAGTRWRNAWSATEYEGGTVTDADAPLERIPVFVRDGSTVKLSG